MAVGGKHSELHDDIVGSVTKGFLAHLTVAFSYAERIRKFGQRSSPALRYSAGIGIGEDMTWGWFHLRHNLTGEECVEDMSAHGGGGVKTRVRLITMHISTHWWNFAKF